MSTGLECNFVEYRPGVWYYILEQGDAPRNSWDWRDFADCYGPFASYEQASKHLSANHANPGGYTVLEYELENQERAPDAVLEKLIKEAISPQSFGR